MGQAGDPSNGLKQWWHKGEEERDDEWEDG